MDLKEYPPRFKFEVFDITSDLEYFKSKTPRFLAYKLIGGILGKDPNISDKISVPICPGNYLRK